MYPSESLARRRGSTAAVAVATALLVGQIGALAHQVLTRHATCPDHGELVHGVAHAPAAYPTGPAQAARPASTGSDHGHDHCLLAPQRRDRLTVPPPPPGRPLDAALRDHAVSARRPPPPAPIALLFLAPKSSPPA